MSKSLFEHTSLSWDAMLNMKKVKLKVIPNPDIFLNKVQEVEFVIFLLDIIKPTINI